jgi:ribonuclease HI/exonuclease III
MMELPALAGVRLPHFSFVSQNLNSLSAYSTSRAGLARRDNILTNITHFAHNHNILCLQESHLTLADSSALKGLPALRSHTILYGNGDGRAGVISVLSRAVTDHYAVAVPPIPVEIGGFVHLTNLSPRDSTRLPFQIFNLYLPSAVDLRLQVLHFIRDQLIAGQHHVLCGDFNFVESLEDGSMAGSQSLSAAEREVWAEVCRSGGLSEVAQPSHTYFRFDAISGKVSSSRLDRFYVSHRPADLTIAVPACQVASAPFNSLRLHRTRAKGDPYARQVFQAAPDHYPISLHFVSTLPSKQRSPNIPTWVVGTIMFQEEFKKEWARAAHEGFAGARAFKAIAHRVARSVFKYRHQASATTQIRVLSAAVALLRQLTQPVPLLARVDDLLVHHRELAPCICPLAGLPTYSLTSKFIAEFLVAGPDARGLQKDSGDPHSASHATNMVKHIKVQLPQDRVRLSHFVDYSDEECRDADRPRFDEGPISSPEDMGAMIAFHWGKIWSKRVGAPSRERIQHYLRRYASRVPVGLCPSMPCRDGDNVHGGTEDTWEELIMKVILASNNSCAGPDGVPFAVYRSLSALAAPFLLDILIALAGGATPPRDFNLGRLFLLPKGTTHKVLDNRPITVNNADNRLLSAVVNVSISPATRALVHASQKGFVAGRRGSDNVEGITDLFYGAIADETELHVLQVDTKKAFDSIDHDFITAVLAHVGFPPWLLLVVLALFAGAEVAPVLAAPTVDRVPIRRGVKQGCPLSPTLFVIIYDPLICEVALLGGAGNFVTPFAFADDLAVAVRSILLVVVVIQLIVAFALFSGLGVNDDKSRLLSSIPLDAAQLVVIQGSPWPDIKVVLSLTYLGIVFGHDVTIGDVFAKPLAKLEARIALYGPVLRRLSLHLRVVAVNVFLLSLFSYHITFYFPLAVIDLIHKAIRPVLVCFNGTAYKLGHLVLGPGLGAYGLVTPLKDIWAWSVAMLANKFDLKALHGRRYEELDLLGGIVPHRLNSMIMSDHVRACANEALSFTLADDGTCNTSAFIHNTQEGRLLLYKRVAARAWRPSPDILDGVRAGSLVNRLLRWGCGSVAAANALTRRWHSGDIIATPFTLAHHFSMTFNALATNRRVASFGEIYTRNSVAHCYFCGRTSTLHLLDSVEHIYGECPVIKQARARFLGAFDLTLPFDVAHSLLAYTGPDPSVKHLRRKLFSAVILFNSTVWSVRWRIFAPAPHHPPLQKSINMVYSQAVTDWNRFVHRSPALSGFSISLTTGKAAQWAPSRRKRKGKVCEEAIQLILAPPPDALLIFTDGGAKPNPGNCGAGVAASRNGSWVVSKSAGLGFGSNNLGEVFAFGMALDIGLSAAGQEVPDSGASYAILSDSTYALGAITKGYNITAAPSDPIYMLVQLARGKFRRLKRLVSLQTLWVKGHRGIEGNERADRNASAGVVISARAPLDRSVVERAIALGLFIFRPP